jgi:hypothetical protein
MSIRQTPSEVFISFAAKPAASPKSRGACFENIAGVKKPQRVEPLGKRGVKKPRLFGESLR